MDIKIHTENYLVVLKYDNWDSDINIDELTRIDYSNLYGEIVTISALLNRVGLLKADCEADVALEKLDLETFEAQKKSQFTKTSISLGEKMSEAKLNDKVTQDPEIIVKRKKLIQKQRDLGYVTAMYWAISSKDKKLEHLLRPTSPEEFADEIVAGKLNTFIIKKLSKKI